jgi:hypothetical protein
VITIVFGGIRVTDLQTLGLIRSTITRTGQDSPDWL